MKSCFSACDGDEPLKTKKRKKNLALFENSIYTYKAFVRYYWYLTNRIKPDISVKNYGGTM